MRIDLELKEEGRFDVNDEVTLREDDDDVTSQSQE